MEIPSKWFLKLQLAKWEDRLNRLSIWIEHDYNDVCQWVVRLSFYHAHICKFLWLTEICRKARSHIDIVLPLPKSWHFCIYSKQVPLWFLVVSKRHVGCVVKSWWFCCLALQSLSGHLLLFHLPLYLYSHHGANRVLPHHKFVCWSPSP
jgi:hypothetical protein